MTALAHEIGVYDINHLKFEVYTEAGKEPTDVKLRDELIVQILAAEAPQTNQVPQALIEF